MTPPPSSIAGRHHMRKRVSFRETSDACSPFPHPNRPSWPAIAMPSGGASRATTSYCSVWPTWNWGTDIQYPSFEGWDGEQLVVDVLRHYGRSNKAGDLLPHLPICQATEVPVSRYWDWEIAYGTWPQAQVGCTRAPSPFPSVRRLTGKRRHGGFSVRADGPVPVEGKGTKKQSCPRRGEGMPVSRRHCGSR